ncbi:MAG: EboA domain-containing protein [Betaproteobacteria bacterium]
MSPAQVLEQWLAARLPGDASAWLKSSAQRLRGGGSDRDLYMSVSLVPRKIGKADLALSATEFGQASVARPGWDPREWSLDQAARVLLLLAAGSDGAAFSRRLDQLCATADVGELVAFYCGLPLYPDQPRHVLRAAEGVRTNMKAVFQAVAHRNPYPSEQLAEPAWNQMVLKALFIGAALDPIIGLDHRANPALARMLCDYAHERWAAGRPVSPELWRCVGPHARGEMLADLGRVLEKGIGSERAAAALALSASPDPAATGLLWAYPELSAAVSENKVSWQAIANPV